MSGEPVENVTRSDWDELCLLLVQQRAAIRESAEAFARCITLLKKMKDL